MSRFFGGIVQQGYVVRNLDAAMEYWTRKLGVGPFVVVRSWELPEIVYRGKTQPLSMSVGFAHSGGIQVELIEPVPGQASTYAEFLASGGNGVHHVGYMVEDFARSVELAAAQGFVPVQSGCAAGTNFAYFETGERECGPLIELMEGSPVVRQLNQMVRDASLTWDGSNPVRTIKL